jgi:hypothetical protein
MTARVTINSARGYDTHDFRGITIEAGFVRCITDDEKTVIFPAHRIEVIEFVDEP